MIGPEYFTRFGSSTAYIITATARPHFIAAVPLLSGNNVQECDALHAPMFLDSPLASPCIYDNYLSPQFTRIFFTPRQSRQYTILRGQFRMLHTPVSLSITLCHRMYSICLCLQNLVAYTGLWCDHFELLVNHARTSAPLKVYYR